MSIKQSEKGITLLLAIIVLATVSAITFSLASIILNEVKTSNDLHGTEAVLYSTQSFLELALFKVSKSVPSDPNLAPYYDALSLGTTTAAQFTANGCDTTNVVCKAGPHDMPSSGAQDVSQASTFNGVTTQSVTLSLENDPTLYDLVSCINSGQYCTGVNVYEIYKPSNPTDFDSTYSKIEVINQNGTSTPSFQFNAMLCKTSEFFLEDCVAHVAGSYDERINIAPGATVTFPATGTLATGRYTLYLENTTTSGKVPKVLVKGYGPGGVAKGLPLIGTVKVQTNAGAKGVYRSYQAIIPKQN